MGGAGGRSHEKYINAARSRSDGLPGVAGSRGGAGRWWRTSRARGLCGPALAAADKRDEDGRLLGSRKAVEKVMPVLEGWPPPIVSRTTRVLEWGGIRSWTRCQLRYSSHSDMSARGPLVDVPAVLQQLPRESARTAGAP
mgnify:CR=1 FL=1